MLYNTIRDPNPVIFIEYRWSHQVQPSFSEDVCDLPLTKGHVLRSGSGLTLAALSLGALEALKVAASLKQFGISTDVVNLRSVSPLDEDLIIKSARKTSDIAFIDAAPSKTGFLDSSVLCLMKNYGGFTKNSIGFRADVFTGAQLPLLSKPSLLNDRKHGVENSRTPRTSVRTKQPRAPY